MTDVERRPADQLGPALQEPSHATALEECNEHPGGFIDEEDGDFASAFASDPSLRRPTFQGAQGEARPLRIQRTSVPVPGRTPIPTHPIILRSIPKHTTAPLTQEQTTRLLRSLTPRDIAILQSLHDYRYLTTLQIRQLFFPSIRSAQLRLQHLKDQGIVYRWRSSSSPA
jgi:hypothetical protein